MQNSEAEAPGKCPDHAACVLVVDDYALVRETLAELLSSRGYRTRAAASADEALGLLEAQPACVVIADWEMPGTNGLELVRRLRSDGRYTHSYVIMYTARQEPGDRAESANAGADELVTKSEPMDRLLERVRYGCEVAARRGCIAA